MVLFVTEQVKGGEPAVKLVSLDCEDGGISNGALGSQKS